MPRMLVCQLKLKKILNLIYLESSEAAVVQFQAIFMTYLVITTTISSDLYHDSTNLNRFKDQASSLWRGFLVD